MLARFLAFALMLVVATSAMAITDSPEDSDYGHVEVLILPTVTVTYISGAMDVAEANALEQICATLVFQVHANGQDIG